MALRFGLCEDAQNVGDILARLVRANGNRLTTGFVATPHLLHALSESGHSDTAYDLLLQESFPSWLYSVNNGATTIWEHWDGIREDGSVWDKDMNSYNHYAYGAVGDWLFGACAGIKCYLTHQWRKFVIQNRVRITTVILSPKSLIPETRKTRKP